MPSSLNGALVQLVRIRACHARGQGFESPTHRQREDNLKRLSYFFCLCASAVARSVGCAGNDVAAVACVCLSVSELPIVIHHRPSLRCASLLSKFILVGVCTAHINSPIISGVRFRSVHSDKRCQIYARTFQMKINIVYFRFVLAQKFAE